jgi:hypothetical protein
MAVHVWFVDRDKLIGPVRAVAEVRSMKKGNGAWAVLVRWDLEDRPAKWSPEDRAAWLLARRFRQGGQYRVGTSAFLTRLAAERFLQGEADRVLKEGDRGWKHRNQPFLVERAERIAPPDVYRKKRSSK